VPVEKDPLRRVNDGLRQLQSGLRPFVEQQMKAAYGADWLKHVSNTQGSSAGSQRDRRLQQAKRAKAA
jgi:Swt1-like HEPN